MAVGKRFPTEFDDVRQFNAELVSWLSVAGPGATLGQSFDSIVTTVRIGDEACKLRGGSTREGIATYLRHALTGDSAFVVVSSKSGVLHRISLGSSSGRISGFYLYSSRVHDRSEVIAAADGTAFGPIEICFKLLDALALLHSRGHQRLRVYPNLGGATGSWRFRVFLADAFLPENLSPFGDPQWESAIFVYSSAGQFRGGALEVGPHTPVGVIAGEILAGALDQGVGIDWAYAGWYSELLGEARRLRDLPISYSEFNFPYGESWEIGPGSGVAFPLPPAPSAATRLGFSDAFPQPPGEKWVAPFLTGRIPIDFDPTKVRGFSGLVAVFQGVEGSFVGLWAMVGDKHYDRAQGRWLPLLDSAASEAWSKVPVSHRFIKSFDILAASDKHPDWDLAKKMSVFSHAPASGERN